MSNGANPEQSGEKPDGKEKGKADKSASKASATSFFALEDAFPDAAAAFSTAIVPPIDQSDALVVIDTNALLLPYKLASGELASLKETYKALAAPTNWPAASWLALRRRTKLWRPRVAYSYRHA